MRMCSLVPRLQNANMAIMKGLQEGHICLQEWGSLGMPFTIYHVCILEAGKKVRSTIGPGHIETDLAMNLDLEQKA